ncbi:10508_t:CDS:2 [Cetraspora pellucida]|uniref:10508_t:CDS:1 n=1 Tax=Cetraspora pellucida TaxID=1433469 RepID=A0A9N9DPM2_9GLOM|nr:10508_t:CDS:2 [Cetraspora pellucida]
MKTNILVYTPQKYIQSQPNVINRLKSIIGNNYDIIHVDSKALNDEPWQDTICCLIVPNIDIDIYYDELKNKANKKIKDYVLGGGNYLGFGSGVAYVTKDLGDQRGQNSLDFFLGDYKKIDLSTSSSTVVELMPLLINQNNEPSTLSQQIQLSTDETLGYFEDVEKFLNIKTLAHYKDPSQAAIIQCEIGSGKAILCGIDLYSSLISEQRNQLIRLIISMFGIKLSQSDVIIPKLSSTFYLSSLRPALTDLWVRGVSSLIDPDGIIKIGNISFRLITSSQKPSSNQLEETSAVNDSVIKIEVYNEPPSALVTPLFNLKKFFEHLSNDRNVLFGWDHNFDFGSTLLYGEVLTSTQTILANDFKFTQQLPTGFVCVATQQIQGRGRGRNSWISPPGCLQFSIMLRHSLKLNPGSMVFIQYLLSLAVVEANIPLRLKWPNDIYAEISLDGSSKPELVKIGGVIVNSNFIKDEFLIIAGCGVNLTNSEPTISINQLITTYNKSVHSSKKLPLFSQEQFLSLILVNFENLYKEFYQNVHGPKSFLDIYYKRWLHSDQVVVLETHDNQKATILGITTDFGFLKAMIIDTNEIVMLQPDGNSFDMMKGLISRKA